MSNDPQEIDAARSGGGGFRSGLEAEVSIRADQDHDAFDGNALVESLDASLRERLGPSRIEMTLAPLSANLLAGDLRIDLHAGADSRNLEEILNVVLEEEIAIKRGLLFRIARLGPITPDPAEPNQRMTSAPS